MSWASTASTTAQVPQDDQLDRLWVSDSYVQSMALQGDTLYLAGGTWYGPTTGSFISMDGDSGRVDSSWPRVDGTVYAMESDGNGGWFIGGDFTSVGARPRTALAHLRADRTVDSWNPIVEGRVRALELVAGRLYIGGTLSIVNGQSRHLVAAVDPVSGATQPWAPAGAGAPQGEVFSLLEHDGTLHVGGLFQGTVGGRSVQSYVRLSPTTALAMGNSVDANGAVWSLESGQNQVIVGGDFTTLGGQPAGKLAIWDLDTDAAMPGVPSFNSTVLATTSLGRRLYVGGVFTSVNGQTRRRAAALDLPNLTLTPWNPDLQGITGGDAGALTLAIDRGRVLIGGHFTSAGGRPCRHFAAVDLRTGASKGWSQPISGRYSEYLRLLRVSGGKIWAAGKFDVVGGVARSGLAALDIHSGAARPWAPTVDNTATAILPSGTKTFIGGGFRYVSGVERPLLVKVDSTTGAVDTGFQAGLTPGFLVTSLARRHGRIYAAGPMHSYAEGYHSLASRDENTGSLAGGWKLGANETIETLDFSPDGNTLFLGGRFIELYRGTTVYPRSRLAAIDALTGAVLPWNPGANNTVKSLRVMHDRMYVGGSFHTIAGQTRRGLAELSLSGVLAPFDAQLAVFPSPEVSALAVQGETLIVGGSFDGSRGQPARHVAAFDTRTGLLMNWFPGASHAVGSVVTRADKLFIAGWFSAVRYELHPFVAGFDLGP